jgi:hypothetical protein
MLRLTSSLSLPAWSVFLLIYPPLSLLFFGVAYVAFRYRWWKAGDSG